MKHLVAGVLHVASNAQEVYRRVTRVLGEQLDTPPTRWPETVTTAASGGPLRARVWAASMSVVSSQASLRILNVFMDPDESRDLSHVGGVDQSSVPYRPGTAWLRMSIATSGEHTYLEAILDEQDFNVSITGDERSQEMLHELFNIARRVGDELDEMMHLGWLQIPSPGAPPVPGFPSKSPGLPPVAVYQKSGDLDAVIDDRKRLVPVLVVGSDLVRSDTQPTFSLDVDPFWKFAGLRGRLLAERWLMGLSVHVAVVPARWQTAFGPQPRYFADHKHGILFPAPAPEGNLQRAHEVMGRPVGDVESLRPGGLRVLHQAASDSADMLMGFWRVQAHHVLQQTRTVSLQLRVQRLSSLLKLRGFDTEPLLRVSDMLPVIQSVADDVAPAVNGGSNGEYMHAQQIVGATLDVVAAMVTLYSELAAEIVGVPGLPDLLASGETGPDLEGQDGDQEGYFVVVDEDGESMEIRVDQTALKDVLEQFQEARLVAQLEDAIIARMVVSSDADIMEEYQLGSEAFLDAWHPLLKLGLKLGMRAAEAREESERRELVKAEKAVRNQLSRMASSVDTPRAPSDDDAKPIIHGSARARRPIAARIDGTAEDKSDSTGNKFDITALRVAAQDLPELPTVVEAFQYARQRSRALLFDAACERGAAASAYRNTRRAAADILSLDALAQAWRDGLLAGTSFTLAAGELFAAAYRTGVSQTALTRFEADYLRNLDGRQVYLGPHVARPGRGRAAWRIYWYADTDTRRVFVGWVGTKLRDLTYSDVS